MTFQSIQIRLKLDPHRKNIICGNSIYYWDAWDLEKIQSDSTLTGKNIFVCGYGTTVVHGHSRRLNWNSTLPGKKFSFLATILLWCMGLIKVSIGT